MIDIPPDHEASLRLACLQAAIALGGSDNDLMGRAVGFASFVLGEDQAAAQRKLDAVSAALKDGADA